MSVRLTRRTIHCRILPRERLTFRYQGRDFRLTDVAKRVVEKLLA